MNAKDWGKTLTVDLNADYKMLGQPTYRGPSCLCGHAEWCETCSPRLHADEQQLQQWLSEEIEAALHAQALVNQPPRPIVDVIRDCLKPYQIRKL